MTHDVLDICTVDYIKQIENNITDTNDDAYLAVMIRGISSKVTNYLNRHLSIKSRTEVFDLQSELDVNNRVQAFPILSVTELEDTLGNPVVLADYLNYKKATGEFILKSTVGIDYGYDSYSLTYTGGMAVDTADFMVKYPEIAFETAMQIIFELKRQKTMALVSGDIGRNGADTYEKWGLRLDLIRVCKPHRKISNFGW